ncbi:uncharacterized protein LOC122395487 [Colletes gigas]|uniref:uncharacterized protein LOC122395487 n=1 Tax=Colletes gigas TaxID=935657 RepID=UPI001C9A5F5F|nr:uncharacterized protein LOC122395487 [Colletes gigas]
MNLTMHLLYNREPFSHDAKYLTQGIDIVFSAKVVVMVPKQIKRSPGPPWRSGTPRYRKSSHGNDYHHRYHGPPGHYQPRKPAYANPPFPHGGDDFDQGHETVNHVHIPHGKDVSHAISYGKGYVPYDHLKGSFSFGRERHPGSHEHVHSEPLYSSSMYSATGAEYPLPGHSYESSHAEMYYSDPESAVNERRNDGQRFYSSRSLEKDLSTNNHIDFNVAFGQGKEQLLHLPQKPTDFYNGLSLQQQHQTQGSVLWPSKIPPATIGGSKEGVVLRDSVSLDEYHQKLQEMTKMWPQILTSGGTALTGGYQSQLVTSNFPAAGQPISSFSGSINWPLNVAQAKQGYAVKEDTMEPPHDFRTMPIRTNLFQAYQPPTNPLLPSLSQTVHG